MKLNNYSMDEDNSMLAADPVIQKIEKKASSPILQDVLMNTYWSNTVGKTKYPGVYEKYLNELECNLSSLIYNKMPYRTIEKTLEEYGYEAGDIRSVFEKVTGVDPVKIEYIRSEDIKRVPANIPTYNLGWGEAKKGENESYFIMKDPDELYSIYHQKNDMEREAVQPFMCLDKAIEELGKMVKGVHRYDIPALDAANNLKENKYKYDNRYIEASDRLFDLQKVGKLNNGLVKEYIEASLRHKKIDYEQAVQLFKVYAEDKISPDHIEEDTPTKDEKDGDEELKALQDKKIEEVIKTKSPQDYFKESLPNRMDETISEQIKNVLSYLNNKNSDLSSFNIDSEKIIHEIHPVTKKMVSINPQNGRVEGDNRATVTTILKIKDSTLPEGQNVKYGVAVFFVGPDGEITTSDSFKGEDDIIYGISEEGFRQYFEKNK